MCRVYQETWRLRFISFTVTEESSSKALCLQSQSGVTWRACWGKMELRTKKNHTETNHLTHQGSEKLITLVLEGKSQSFVNRV